MRTLGKLFLLVAIALIGFGGAPVTSAATQDHGTVYLMRGGFNVFSLGLDTLGDELDEKGIPAQVKGFNDWRVYAAAIEAEYAKDKRATRPIVIMGHSWGANAALLMAAELGKKGVPVDLVVTFDLLNEIKVAPNVKRAINFYVEGGGVPAEPAPGFKGKLENVTAASIDPSIWHLTIEKDERIHERAVEAAVKAFR